VTWTAWALAVLAGLTLLGCVAFALPDRKPDPHPYETDPLTDEGDHIGRREWLGEGETRRLGPSRLRDHDETVP